ncbi:BCL-6 corepressor like protein [Argiope bruennichi]|uniref:BCL-6 corepressor like protein n=1 Tax=Argiope bruennichi TaxID=94029 RepID=A0A8T0E167_ARGBR|nr:BCL-6 corepressor like protein [Argiope bruennichi]
MYYPPLFTSVRPFDPRANSLDVPVVRENPLDLSVKTIRPSSDAAAGGADAEELMMLDHRKLANLAASHSLSAMGRQLLDPSLYRLGYGAEAVVPGLTPPFCFDRTTGVAVPTSLAGHQMLSTFLQQRERLEQQQQQAFYAARNSAVAQQQAAVAAAAAAYMDPANLPLHLRNGLTQREAAAALAATRGLYAPSLPTPMMLPAFSLYTEDKGAFTSLRNPTTSTGSTDRSVLNGVTAAAAAPTLEAARYAEHIQRLREQHLQQHQTSGKCSSTCCTSSSLSGLGQSSVPCACCVQTPSQAALCARSPMGCANKDPTSAATGKVCDFPQPGLTFLHRPTATTAAATTTTSSTSSSELRLSVSSLCTTQTTAEPTTVNSSRDKQQHSGFRSTIWNAGLPSVSTGGKTAFSVPKKKENSHKDSSTHHSKEHRSSGSIKDILKDNQNNNSNTYEGSKTDAPKVSSHSSKHDNVKKANEKYYEDFSLKYCQKEKTDTSSFNFHKNSMITPHKHTHSGMILNGNDALTTVTSVTPIVPTRCEGGSIPITKMPPLLEAVRPSELPNSIEKPQDPVSSVHSPQGPPPLIAVSSMIDYSAASIIKSSYTSSENSSLRIPSTIYPATSVPVPSYKHQAEKIPSEVSNVKTSSKSPKKSSHSTTKYNGMPIGFMNGEHAIAPLAIPKPIPAKPIPQLPAHHLTPNATHFSSHYRPAQHQLSLQTHNEWIPHANPNVTVAPLPQPTTSTVTATSTTVVTSAHRPSKPVQSNSLPSATAMHREPDYADTPNVLQSLLVRSSTGMDPMTTMPTAMTKDIPTSVITSANPLPLFSIDYRFPIGPQMSLVNNSRDEMPDVAYSTPLTVHHSATSTNAAQKDKSDVLKSESASQPLSITSKHKKRSANTEDNGNTKKRILSSNFNSPMPRYSFQPASFINEVSEAPECPYTFHPEPPLNYTTQVKDENQKPLWREVPEKTADMTNFRELPKSPVLVPKSPSKPTEATWSPKSGSVLPVNSSTLPQTADNAAMDRLAAIRARRKLRKKLLSRIYLQRRPLATTGNVMPDRAALDRQLAVRYTRKLLSQLTLRWAHRRYVYKWHSIKRKSLSGKVVVQKKKNGKVIYEYKQKNGKGAKSKIVNTEKSTSKSKDSSCSLPMPPEMKRLMVNKALGETQLHRAARLGYPQAVAYCLKSKCVSVNVRDNAGYTPLHECCSRGHLDIARALLQYGADVNASAAGGIRPLHDAVENDHVEIVRLLLSYGADPTIATYSGLEPMKLARSAMMAEFLQGFLADISGEVDSRPHLPWRFWGSAKCLDPEDGGYDVFSGVPSDGEDEGEGDNDFLFEVSDSPHLPTFRLLLPAASSKAQGNYLRLNDVLRKLSITKEEFLKNYGHIEILSLPRHEFEASATCSPLLSGNKLDNPFASRPNSDRSLDNGSTTDLIRLDKGIRKVLGIETISVR